MLFPAVLFSLAALFKIFFVASTIFFKIRSYQGSVSLRKAKVLKAKMQSKTAAMKINQLEAMLL